MSRSRSCAWYSQGIGQWRRHWRRAPKTWTQPWTPSRPQPPCSRELLQVHQRRGPERPSFPRLQPPMIPTSSRSTETSQGWTRLTELFHGTHWSQAGVVTNLSFWGDAVVSQCPFIGLALTKPVGQSRFLNTRSLNQSTNYIIHVNSPSC